MGNRIDYSKVSLKSKTPKSIRCNESDLQKAMQLSGKKTVQSLIDYLISKYLIEKDMTESVQSMNKHNNYSE